MSEIEGGGASRSTDPAAGTSSATDVSLREFLTAAINESRRECRDNISNLSRHVDDIQKNNAEKRAEEMADITRRFDGVNEFRNALSDLSKLMATKDGLGRVEEKFESSLKSQSDRLTVMERRFDVREGQSAGSKVTTGVLVTVITVGVGVIGLIVVIANVFTNP